MTPLLAVALTLAVTFAVIWLMGTYRSRCLRDPLDADGLRAVEQGEMEILRDEYAVLAQEYRLNTATSGGNIHLKADFHRRLLDELRPLDGDPLDRGWGRL